jgi:hypothetical protein
MKTTIHIYIDGKFDRFTKLPIIPRIGDYFKIEEKAYKVESVQFIIDSPKKGFNFIEILLKTL